METLSSIATNNQRTRSLNATKNTKNLSLNLGGESDVGQIQAIHSSRSMYASQRKASEMRIYSPVGMRHSPTTEHSTTEPSISQKRGKSLSLSISTACDTPKVRRRSQTMIPETPITQTPMVGFPSHSHNLTELSMKLTDLPGTSAGFREDEEFIAKEVYKENAYPDGPLEIVPNLFLYSEPTPQQCNEFDIVINCAQEISDTSNSHLGEYVHLPWTHTTKIAEDLPRLTAMIDKAMRDGHKVLVHCQCGVSRSASLIVAYIMRFRRMSLNDGYDFVKKLAPDISPNMTLIFQLMEFGQSLKQKLYAHGESTRSLPNLSCQMNLIEKRRPLTSVDTAFPDDALEVGSLPEDELQSALDDDMKSSPDSLRAEAKYAVTM